MNSVKARFGALVISLDFELIWGVRDLYHTNHPYMVRIIQERMVIPKILDLFEKYDIAATWATVGCMFARSSSELKQYIPKIKPVYSSRSLDPYDEMIGEGEWDDPLHFANDIICQIQSRKRQEIATHTFSHYYCNENGQTRESFSADLDSALSIARKHGINIKSIVFPRNQHNPDYDDILVSRGIKCYRGTEQHSMYQVKGRANSRYPHKRLYRLVDSLISLSGNHLVNWENVTEDSGLCNIAASRYLRPISSASSLWSRFRLKRITSAMEEAAKNGKIFHLWAHPQDFGVAPGENLAGLKDILDEFMECRKKYGMVSLNMGEAVGLAREKQVYREEVFYANTSF